MLTKKEKEGFESLVKAGLMTRTIKSMRVYIKGILPFYTRTRDALTNSRGV